MTRNRIRRTAVLAARASGLAGRISAVGNDAERLDAAAAATAATAATAAALSGHQPDDAVKITVRRGDKDVELTAHLGSKQA